MLIVTLISGFAVKMLTFCPGVFSPYPKARLYVPKMTNEFGYICICIPSGGEQKCTVLRNMVGAVSCMPKQCKCHYHVVFADEGYRPHLQDMWGKFRDVLQE